MFERLAEWYLSKRCGRMILPRFWRGMAVAGPDTYASCAGFDNSKPSVFTVCLGSHPVFYVQAGAVMSIPNSTISPDPGGKKYEASPSASQ